MKEKTDIRYIKMNTTLDDDVIKLINLTMNKYRAVRFDYDNNSCITVLRERNSIIGLMYEIIEDDCVTNFEEMYLKGNDLLVREKLIVKYNKTLRTEYETTEHPYNLLKMINEPGFKSRVLKALIEDDVENGDSIKLGSCNS